MEKIRKGDIVGRKSYGKDIIFSVQNIIKTQFEEIAILKGVISRIEADSNINDLEKIDKKYVEQKMKFFEDKIEKRALEVKNLNKDNRNNFMFYNKKIQEKILTGKILHLDGDKKYSEKSFKYYRKLGLDAIVRNIPEYRQPRVVYLLLKTYEPDILVVTGHDGMIKKGIRYYDIYNYRNSKYFIETVKEARKYDIENEKNTVIFAGACQSYFEAIISAGANFASSPARILIDFIDPLIVAEKIAFTDKYKYVTIDDIADELRDGKNGVSGVGANGKMSKINIL